MITKNEQEINNKERTITSINGAGKTGQPCVQKKKKKKKN